MPYINSQESRPVVPGVSGMPWQPQILADQLTQEVQIMPTTLIQTGNPGFSDLPTALESTNGLKSILKEHSYSWLCIIMTTFVMHNFENTKIGPFIKEKRKCGCFFKYRSGEHQKQQKTNFFEVIDKWNTIAHHTLVKSSRIYTGQLHSKFCS